MKPDERIYFIEYMKRRNIRFKMSQTNENESSCLNDSEVYLKDKDRLESI